MLFCNLQMHFVWICRIIYTCIYNVHFILIFEKLDIWSIFSMDSEAQFDHKPNMRNPIQILTIEQNGYQILVDLVMIQPSTL